MNNNKKYTERPLPYGAKAICVECKPKLRAKIKFKAYKFMDGYFNFLEVNSLIVLGYYLVTRNNTADTLYVAYRPEDCDVDQLITETLRYFRNIYGDNVVDIDKDGNSKLGYCSSFRIFTNYGEMGFRIPIASYAKEFEEYLIDELHLGKSVAAKHVEYLELISKKTWRSTKPANSVYRRYPTDIEKYVSTLYLDDKNEKEQEKTLKTTLTLFLRCMQYRREQYLKRLLGYQTRTITTIDVTDTEAKPVVKAKPVKAKPVVKAKPDKKSLRIDINMEDIDEFFDYLEKREPNRQQRKRYVKQLEDLYQNGWNQYKHNTFIDDNKYKVNAKDVEVFVNGMKSRDFNVTVKEYEDTIELYLSYRWAKKYKPTQRNDKEEAIPPRYKLRAKKQEDKKESDSEGKKISITIDNYNSWKSNEDDLQSPNMQATTQYLGEVTGQRKTASMKNTVIIEDEQTVNIKMELNENTQTPSDEKIVDLKDTIEEQDNNKSEEIKTTEQINSEDLKEAVIDEPQESSVEEENIEESSDEEQNIEESTDEEENIEETADDTNNNVEEPQPSERVVVTEEEDKMIPATIVQKRKRNKGWLVRLIEWIKLWFFKNKETQSVPIPQVIKESDNSETFEKYTERIINLNQAKIRGEVIVAKPVLLLALIDGINEGVYKNNRFHLDDWLEERYMTLMAKYTQGSQFDVPTSIDKPFWHLESDGFWHLQSQKEHDSKSKTPSKLWLKENVEFARFDDDLWLLLQNREWRRKMHNFIIEKKLPQSLNS